MSAWLPRLLARTPPVVKGQALLLLFRATAGAFQRDMPRLWGLSYEQCLLAYARFTAEEGSEALRRGGDLAELQGRLYRSAYRLGRTSGWLLRVRGVDDVMALGRFLYSILDIDWRGSPDGEITISHCYFSRFYSPDVCRLMSAMDHGLLAGVANGGELVFRERITEGGPCCRARFTLADRYGARGCPSVLLRGHESHRAEKADYRSRHHETCACDR